MFEIKFKNTNREIADQEWFSKQGLQSNKTKKTRDGYRGQIQQPQF